MFHVKRLKYKDLSCFG